MACFTHGRPIYPDDYDAVARIIPSMPMPGKLIIVSAWLLGAFGGAWSALRITDWRWSAVVVTIFVIVGGVINFVELPHPVWMRVCAVVLPIIGGWVGWKLHRRPYPGEALLG